MTARRLPDARTLRRLYVVDGLSFREIAARYGLSKPDAVRLTMRRDAAANGWEWPAKQSRPGWQQRKAASVSRVVHDGVVAVMIRAEILECCRTRRVTVAELAEVSGVSSGELHRILSERRTRISRRTAQKIMDAIVSFERGRKPQRQYQPLRKYREAA